MALEVSHVCRETLAIIGSSSLSDQRSRPVRLYAARASRRAATARDMSQRGTLSPRRQDASAAAPFRLGVSDTEPIVGSDSSGTLHSRARPPSNMSYLVLATLEGLLSMVAFYSALSAAVPVLHAVPHAASDGSPAPPFPALRAVRSGLALALGAPLFLCAARCAIFVLQHVKGPDVQQPRLGFALPVGLDEDAVFDLYAVGMVAGVLGVCVPGLEIVGSLLGMMLKSFSGVLAMLVLVVLILVVYLAVGAWLSYSASAEGFTVHTRPTVTMCGLCAAGHVVLLAGCFYSPDIGRAVGFFLGLVHIVRLLQQAFLYPVGAGTTGCDDGELVA